MLTVDKLTGGYTQADTLHEVHLQVRKGQVVSVLGGNGAGKTSTMRAISGLLPRATGQIQFNGKDISTLRPDRRASLGLAHVPEGRMVFPTLSVLDNLDLGAWSQGRADAAQRDRVFALFPRLQERKKQLAGTLSGGEQQMLAIGRALMAKPLMMILDEPSMGLAPNLTEEVFKALEALKAEGMTLLLVEQFARRALQLSDYAYVLQRGSVVLGGDAADLLNDEQLHKAYLS